nr:MAG TPA: hypothetical protein [Bacteriophage sp.]
MIDSRVFCFLLNHNEIPYIGLFCPYLPTFSHYLCRQKIYKSLLLQSR